MADRDFDLIVYGATGFTGKLVVDHLARREGIGEVRWAVAGRNKAKLDSVLAEADVDVPVVVADAEDPASLAEMARRTATICTTVGPYATYGSPLVAACVEAGTDYCDLTGEPQWMRRMIDAHQADAEASGARIVHTCGFDSIPSDIGTYFVQQQMLQRHGVPASRVSGRLKGARGGVSGGTLASLVNVLAEADVDPEVRKVMADPYGLNPQGLRHGPDSGDRLAPGPDRDFGGWQAPFVMAQINTRVVRRSNAVMGFPWGEDFRYDEAMLTGRGPVGAAMATAIAGGMLVGTAAAQVGPVRGLLERVLPDAGTGPSPTAQENGFWDFRLYAEHPTDRSRSLVAKLVGDRDPGYGSTARMLGESALALATGQADVGGGFWTPSSAIGDALLERLPAHAGVTMTILD